MKTLHLAIVVVLAVTLLSSSVVYANPDIIAQLEAKITELENKIKNKEAKIDAKKQKVNELKSQLEVKTKNLEEVTAKLDQKNRKIDRLENKIEEFREKLDRKNTKLDNKQDKIDYLKIQASPEPLLALLAEGVSVSPYYEYHDNGNLKVAITYDVYGGSITSHYYDNGKARQVTYVHNGIMKYNMTYYESTAYLQDQYFYSNGKISQSQHGTEDNSLWALIEYYENGNRKLVLLTNSTIPKAAETPDKTIKSIIYFDNGDIQTQDSYEYDEDGRIVSSHSTHIDENGNKLVDVCYTYTYTFVDSRYISDQTRNDSCMAAHPVYHVGSISTE